MKISLALLTLSILAIPFTADACSPGKLSILKQRCHNADSISAKKLYCFQKQNPHSVKFIDEKNYNIK